MCIWTLTTSSRFKLPQDSQAILSTLMYSVVKKGKKWDNVASRDRP